MYTHGRSVNGVEYRDSELMSRTKSLSRHLRDPDKVDNVWTESPRRESTRTKLKEPVTQENLLLRRFPLMPKRNTKLHDYNTD